MSTYSVLKNRIKEITPSRDELKVIKLVAACAMDPYRPLMVHLMVTRKCNLECGYCYEADRVSAPVPFDDLAQRIEHVDALGAVFVTITGGEPMLHPQIYEVIAKVRQQGMIPVMNSNGFLLNADKVEKLNNAGLFAVQISVDNVRPNDTTKKSLKPLLPKLRVLSRLAKFRVRINTVLGAGDPQEAIDVAKAAVDLGFDAKCSFVRDDKGAVIAVSGEAKEAYDIIRSMGRRAPAYLSEDFQVSLADQGTVEWKCRSGGRYFMVFEKGLVHLCESSHNSPGTPLLEYTRKDIKRNFNLTKSCAPTCAVAYAHQASRMDAWRAQDMGRLEIKKQAWADVTPQKRLPLFPQ